jgi:hypothetical protein
MDSQPKMSVKDRNLDLDKEDAKDGLHKAVPVWAKERFCNFVYNPQVCTPTPACTPAHE